MVNSPVCPACGERLDEGQPLPVVSVMTHGESTGERTANLICCAHCAAAVGVLPDLPMLPQQQ